MKSHSQSRHSHHHMTLPLPAPEQSAPSARHGSQITVHQPRIATAPVSHHSSLATHHCLNQSPAKQNRTPMQIIGNNQQRSKAIASLCCVFCDWKGSRAHSRKPVRLATKSNQGGQARLCLCHERRQHCVPAAGRPMPRRPATCELDEAAAFRYRSRFC